MWFHLATAIDTDWDGSLLFLFDRCYRCRSGWLPPRPLPMSAVASSRWWPPSSSILISKLSSFLPTCWTTQIGATASSASSSDTLQNHSSPPRWHPNLTWRLRPHVGHGLTSRSRPQENAHGCYNASCTITLFKPCDPKRRKKDRVMLTWITPKYCILKLQVGVLSELPQKGTEIQNHWRR